MSKQKNRPEVGEGTEIPGEIQVERVSHAPWNPRTPEELEPSHPAMENLINSVRSLGVV